MEPACLKEHLSEAESDGSSPSSDLEGLAERVALLAMNLPQPELRPKDPEQGVPNSRVVGKWLQEFPMNWQRTRAQGPGDILEEKDQRRRAKGSFGSA